MPTLLHISDLHRTSEPRLDNSELFSAIASDATRWHNEGIPRPDLVVVSGDLVQGSDVSSSDPDSDIESQYIEVGDFLSQLAVEFVDSDRSRVIIVPGNHDVHWGRAKNAMAALPACPSGIASKALKANSNLRWDWKNQQAYEISDEETYSSRYEHFQRFRLNFYEGVDSSRLQHHDENLVFFEYPCLNLVVAGFSSWYGNDCFCPVGDIDSASLSHSRRLLSQSKAPVAVAVWHHSIVGGPRVNDYMDQRIVHRLIDFGFNIGLHGHQHFPDAAPFDLHLPNLTSMVVVGAGSLAVGNNELPMGERRQFNIIEIDSNTNSVTVYVRSMSTSGIFSGSYRDDFGGNTFIKLRLPSSTRSTTVTPTQLLDKAFHAIATKNYTKALDILAQIDPSHAHKKRQIEIKALEGLERHEDLIRLLDPPMNVEETVQIVTLLLNTQQFDKALATLENASTLIDQRLYHELSAVIASKRAQYEF